MYEDTINRYTAPAREFQSLVLENTGKLAHLQFESARAYTEMGLKSLRDGFAVRDGNDFQSYVASRQEVVRDFVAKAQDDAQSIVGLQQEFGQSLQRLLETNSRSLTEAVESVTRPAARGNGSTKKSA